MKKRYLKKIVSSLLVVSMFLSSINIVGAVEKEAKEDNEKNKVQTMIDVGDSTTSTENKTGYVDAGIEYDRIPDYSAFSNGGFDKATVIPSSYSSVEKDYVTAIRNQNPWGTCWAFAAVAAMESYALSHGLVDSPEDINLSEFALAYLTFKDEEMLLNKTGDYSYIGSLETGFNAGGNDEMAYKALSNGLALYNDDEVQYTQSTESGKVPEIQWDEENISYVLTGQKYINIADVDQVKTAVMENGAVTTSYWSADKYMNSYHLYNYNYEKYSTNHAVAIVGWDDNKPKELFTVGSGDNTHTPENDGAWLIKNSWGTWAGDNGYVWISYEDCGILSADAVVYEIAPKDNYPVLYQHDGATIAYSTTYGYSFASVFEVEGNKEIVNALSFFTRSTQMGYTAYLYDNSDGSELDEGELVATTSGITTYAGYYTVDFDTDYMFMKGDKFTVIVEFASLGSMVYAVAYQDLADEGTAYSTCVEGQSYIIKYPNGEFEDVVDLGSYKNVSLKAHSTPVVDENTPTKIKSIKFTGNDQVSISWAPVEGAVSYELWKSNSEGGSQHKVITGITDTSYIDKTIAGSSDVLDMIKFGETYYYKVRAVYADNSKNDYSMLRKVEIIPEKTETKLEVNDDNKLVISWNKLDYVDGYNIYISQDDKENLEKVADVAKNVTSYTYDQWLQYYGDYYVAVEPYVNNSNSQKICGEYDIKYIHTQIKSAEMIDAHYIIEDSVYLQWKYTDGNLADGIDIIVYRNGMNWDNETIEAKDNSYILDISGFEPGDLLEIECRVYYEIGNSGWAINEFYANIFTIGTTFDEEVFWYVKDNQIYVCMPNASMPEYEIYYGYDEAKVGFSNVVEVTKDEIKAGYPLPVDSCPITGCKIGVRQASYLGNQVIPKGLIKVGGEYVEPQLQVVPNAKATASATTVKLQAVITNKVEGFYYEYQWYVSDYENGTATPIDGANSPQFEVYMGAPIAKYYYCEITCKYNGEEVYTTVNEKGKRTRVLGLNCFDNVIISDIQAQNYTGGAITPSVIIMEDDVKLIQGTHYTVAYENNVNVGTAVARITFIGAYSAMGTKVKEFVINPISISSLTVEAIGDQIYTGNAIKPQITVKKGSTSLVVGTDYTVEYTNNTAIGTATVVIKGMGNYTGTITKTFNIVKIPSSKLSVGSISAQTYTGQALSPTVVVKYGNVTLVKGTDYDVTYTNNVKVGTATVTISLKGNYSGQLNATFAIVGKSIAGATVSAVSNYTYTGVAITPSVTVKDGNTTLVLGTDYTVTYNNNVNAGTAKVNITGKGNYAGTLTKEFAITPMSCEGFVVSGISSYTYTGGYITPAVTVKNGSVNLTNGTDYTVSYANNMNVGTANVTITFKGNYSGTIGKTFVINSKAIDNITIGAISDQMYTGSALTPTVVAKDGSYTLVNGKDYTLSYANNVNGGTATVTLTGKGNYSGTKKITFTIKSVPEKITSSSVAVTDSSSCISKITSGTTAATLVSKLNESKYVAVYNGNTKVDNNALVGTGMTVCIMDGSKVAKKYTVIITGDTSGDGKINITDMIAVKANILKKSTLTGVYSKAGDVNGDSKINITDFIKIKATLLGKDSITGVAVN